MTRILFILYGLVSYTLGVASLVLLILFANGHIADLLPAYASLGIEQPFRASMASPLLTDVALIVLFGLQHSIMARPGFKAALTRFMPRATERSTYVLMTAVVTFILIAYWQPLGGSLWQVENETGRLALTAVYYLGWTITFAATYMINHFHLFGLQQSFRPHDPDAGAKVFVTPMLYRIIRHPIQTGIFIAMLATPDMTMGRLVLAVGMIGYIAVGLMFEERDLIAEFGDTYRDYRKRVPALIPMPGRKA